MSMSFKTLSPEFQLRVASVSNGRPFRAATRKVVAMAGTKKVNSYDEDWEKGFFGTGLFLEDNEASNKSAFRKIEEKKLLSAVEKSGLLSKLESAGLTLTKIEQSGLLSTAERLGLLSVAEDLLTANPATIASGSLPFIVLSIASLVFIPHDGVSGFLSYSLAAVFAGVASAALVTGFVVAAIQEE